jgi:hypothetical protein
MQFLLYTTLFKVENILEKFDFLHCNPFRLPSVTFGICTVVSLQYMGHLLKLKYALSIICKRGLQTHAVRLIECTMMFKVENILEKFDY